VIRYSNGDTLIGGDGNDTIEIRGAADRIVNLSGGNQVVGTGQVTGFENIDASGSTGSHVLTGDAGTNLIRGGSGGDRIDAGAGADTIDGGSGDDTVVYDSSDVLVDGGAGVDQLLLQGGGSVEIDLDN